jgi:hypothetical protein
MDQLMLFDLKAQKRMELTQMMEGEVDKQVAAPAATIGPVFALCGKGRECRRRVLPRNRFDGVKIQRDGIRTPYLQSGYTT